MLTTVLIARNEEHTIKDCLSSVSFSDEIVLVDNASEDLTVKVSRAFSPIVVGVPESSDFSYLRMRGEEEATHDWILQIDADERVSEELKKSLTSTLQNPTYDSYRIRRREHFMGQILTQGEVATAYQKGFVRLYKKGTGSWRGSVHEVYVSDKPSGVLEGFFEHFPHNDISSFISDINSYSSLRARELAERGERMSLFGLLFFPPAKFLYTYFLKGGFLEGRGGFIYSFLMSFHSFLVRAKLYLR